MAISDEQLNMYTSLFKGRSDVYARRWEKDGKCGYAPSYKFEWKEYTAHKAKGGNFQNFQNKEKIPLTKEIIRHHLSGLFFIGIYPLLEDNSSFFIAIDLDGENWKTDCENIIKEFKVLEIPIYLEKSFSGNGAHLWVFFEDKYPAYKSRKIISEIIRKALNFSQFEKEISFDRLFPNQDYHTGKGFGNLIALPLNGKAKEENRMVFLNPENFNLIPDQWNYLKNINKISIPRLNQLFLTLSNEDKSEGIGISENINYYEKDILLITLKNQIILNKNQINKKLSAFLKENLNFVNSEYIVKQKIGKGIYGVQKYFNLITEFKDEIRIPRGFKNQLIGFCSENKIIFKVLDERKKLKNIEFHSKIKLNNLQEQIIEKCNNHDSGIIVSPPGSGKTILGLELITKKSQPAIILVHRKQIYDQWMERIQGFLGISKQDIGQISGSKKKISGLITVAMIQSLIKLPNLNAMGDDFGTVIIDECHHIPAKSFREVITNFNPSYIYGLTATPNRKYNDEKLIFLFIGDVICDAKNIEDNTNEIAKRSIQLIIRNTSLSVPYNKDIDDFQILSKFIIFDSERNKLIADDVISNLKSNKKILILTERKDHVEVLNIYLRSYCEVITITGDDSQSMRKLKLQQIKSGHFQVLIATGQLLGEGLDLEELDYLFLVYPFSFEGKLIQYIGRILRSEDSKYIYDYRDKNIEFLENQFKKRDKYYRKVKLIRA
jgi:superfamily II DNA or RNA helicase